MRLFGKEKSEIEKRLDILEQRLLNLEIECYKPIAEVKVSDTEVQRRMTIRGMVEQMLRIVRVAGDAARKPKIHVV